MAVTKIWAIKNRLDHVIDYATNNEKTNTASFKDLHKTIKYAINGEKTEEKLFVTSINCNTKTALKEMAITKEKFNKTTGILGFHAYQSFAENEVTAELAHNIGIKLAEEIWGDRFEVIVSTHLNTGHLHNHFVLNSVSFKDGKKYYDNLQNYAVIRKTSDLICEEHGLSVVTQKTSKKGVKFENFYNKEVRTSSYLNLVKQDLDYAIEKAYNYDEFANTLKRLGYELNYRNTSYIKSIKKEPYKRFVRLESNFGNEYSTGRIMERIKETNATNVLPIFNKSKIYKSYNKNNIRNILKPKGLIVLFICYLLKIQLYKNNCYQKRLSPFMQKEVKKMDQYSRNIQFLVKYRIEIKEQLSENKDKLSDELSILLRDRKGLWYRYNKSDDELEKQEILGNINRISNKIKDVRDNLKSCSIIESKIPKMQDELERQEKTITKQKKYNRDVR